MNKNINNSKTNNIEKTFSLLHDVLEDCFTTDVLLLDDLNIDSKKVDRGLREMMWEGFSSSENLPEWFHSLNEQDCFYVIKSNLGFYNFVISIIDGITPNYILVGPFRSEDISASFFEQIMRDAHVPQATMEKAASVYRMLPLVNLQSIISVTKRILIENYKDFSSIEPQIMEFKEETHIIRLDEESIEERLSNSSKEYQKYILLYKDSIIEGNSTDARLHLKNLINSIQLDSIQRIAQKKKIIHVLNELCMFALLTTNIHPKYVLRLFFQMDSVIEQTEDTTRLSYIPYDICHKSCLLVKNHNHPEYSKSTRDIVDYIAFHLDEELSLSLIAEHFSKNASTLSNAFHKETGTTLTEYIKQTKIREAIRLFNTTDMSVSEVSVAIGYTDFAYFSRVFKQVTGISPREYRKI